MAIKKCKECGDKVSTKATSCPHCGAVLKKERKSIGCGGLIIVLILLGVIGSFLTEQLSPPAPTTAKATKEAPPKTPEQIREGKIA